MAREKFLKITLNWKGISYQRASVCHCGRMRPLSVIFWGPYSFPLGSSANHTSAIQLSYWSRHTNTVYQLKLPTFKRLCAKRKVRPKTCEHRGTNLGQLTFILNHFYGSTKTRAAQNKSPSLLNIKVRKTYMEYIMIRRKTAVLHR